VTGNAAGRDFHAYIFSDPTRADPIRPTDDDAISSIFNVPVINNAYCVTCQNAPFPSTKKLPSNLRHTTRECVHSFMRGHFRSRDYAIRFALAETRCYTQRSRLYKLLNRRYCRSKFYIAGIGLFSTFLSM